MKMFFPKDCSFDGTTRAPQASIDAPRRYGASSPNEFTCHAFNARAISWQKVNEIGRASNRSRMKPFPPG